jgi:hypothetical protein
MIKKPEDKPPIPTSTLAINNAQPTSRRPPLIEEIRGLCRELTATDKGCRIEIRGGRFYAEWTVVLPNVIYIRGFGSGPFGEIAKEQAGRSILKRLRPHILSENGLS